MIEAKTILLVEDEAFIALAERRTLEKHGYTVLTASSGAAAVRAAEENPGIDLVLMDVDLGSGMDGPEAAARILEHRDLPVVFLSSHTEPEVVARTERVSSFGYVVKDSGETVLVASIKMAFRLFEAKRDAADREAALAESERRFHRMLDVVPDMISIHDPEFRILYSNWQGFGAVPEDRRKPGTRCHQTYRGLSDVCPDCRAGRVLRMKTPFRTEAELPDGTWVDIRVIPLLDAAGNVESFMEWVRDITESRRAERALREERERLRFIIDGAGLGTWEWDVRSNRTVFNDTWAAMLGYSLEDLTPYDYKTWVRLVHPDDIGRAETALDDCISGRAPQYECEFRMRHKDGHWIWILDQGRVMTRDDQGRPSLMFGTHTEIDRIKRTEEELRRGLDEKELLLRETHHRIKNNIASIASLLSLHAGHVDSPEAQSALNEALGRVRSMQALYTKMLSAREDVREVSVPEFLSDIADSVVELFPATVSISLEKRFDALSLDAKQLFPLGIILNELLTNAMKYAFTGRAAGRIEAALERRGDRVTFILRDDGTGLPPGFDPADSRGFGITLVRILSEQLGGTARFESEAGTRVAVEFSLR